MAYTKVKQPFGFGIDPPFQWLNLIESTRLFFFSPECISTKKKKKI